MKIFSWWFMKLIKCNLIPILTYFVLVSLSTIVLVHLQPNHRYSPSSLEFFSTEKNVSSIRCRFPRLSLNGEGLDFTFSKTFHPVCRAWFHPIVIEGHSIRQIDATVDCTVLFYLGHGDREYDEVPIPLIFNQSTTVLSDYFTVQCTDRPRRNSTSKNKIFYPPLPYAAIRFDPKINDEAQDLNTSETNFNVLIIGLDSISNLQFQRMLPNTYRYMTNELKAMVLEGYNIVGDGTPQQLIPMLTGFKETELPSTLRRDENGSFVDIYPFIWNRFRQQGYVTGYAEDRVEYGIWTLRLKGFAKNPTDHYLPPFYQMNATKSLLYRYDAHCIRNETSFDLFLSYVNQFWSSYSTKKKFFFAFFKQYTHDGYTAGSLLDQGLMRFLQKFQTYPDAKRTLLILMTDHGARFSLARQTPQGKLEERLPLMSWIFPSFFNKSYPQAMQHFQTNLPRLVTPFDIHATLVSLFELNQTTFHSMSSQNKQRNISLFHLIPIERTCDDIQLEPHWCSCLQWQKISLNATQVQRAVVYVVDYINRLLNLVKNNQCALLQAQSVTQAQIYAPNQELLTFSRSADIDGRVAEYGDKKMDIVFYQITFQTKPNNAIYEATVEYSANFAGFQTDLNHISRLNAYQSAASCIERDYPHLRKFCLCIK